MTENANEQNICPCGSPIGNVWATTCEVCGLEAYHNELAHDERQALATIEAIATNRAALDASEADHMTQVFGAYAKRDTEEDINTDHVDGFVYRHQNDQRAKVACTACGDKGYYIGRGVFLGETLTCTCGALTDHEAQDELWRESQDDQRAIEDLSRGNF